MESSFHIIQRNCAECEMHSAQFINTKAYRTSVRLFAYVDKVICHSHEDASADYVA